MNRTSVIVVACGALYLLWGPVPGSVRPTRSIEPIASQRFGVLGYSASERYAHWNRVQFLSGPPRPVPPAPADEIVNTWNEELLRTTALLTTFVLGMTFFALRLVDRRERIRMQPLA